MESLPLSTFNPEKLGIDISATQKNLTYLYGLTDFFNFVFQDTTTLNLLLTANATEAAEIYSKFLQHSSILTLSGIQTLIGSTIKLILIEDSDRIGVTYNYNVDTPISSAKYLADRPFLPNKVLENGVDFSFVQSGINGCILHFAQPLNSYNFSQRVSSTGVNQYAIWVMDSVIDEQMIYNNYGSLLNVNPQISEETFSNFIFGLYYLYYNGPTLRVMEQALNLVLGVPLIRSPGTILDIRYNGETHQYIIITNTDQYLLPQGLTPLVNIGDSVNITDSLGKWIVLKDFISSGNWWEGVNIPISMIKNLVGNQTNRIVTPESNYDYIMENYLFRNSFLIQMNIGNTPIYSKYFSYIQSILYNAKPAWALPVFIWSYNATYPYPESIGTISDGSVTIEQGVPIPSNTINSFDINGNYI